MCSSELFYQLVLRGFSNFGYIYFSKSAPLHELVSIGIESDDFDSDKFTIHVSFITF